MRILYATNNPGKLLDASRLSKHLGFEVFSLKDLGIKLDVEENQPSFEGNSLKKYIEYSKMITDPNLWIITDDSGLEIEALNNEPGVVSRRWTGYEMTDEQILAFVLEKMKGVENRKARFRGVLTVGKAGVEPQQFEFMIEGELLEEPQQASWEPGLPYRSIFYLPQHGKMLHEIHDLPYEKRPGLQTHRELGLSTAFEHIKSFS
ncbi:MAG: non-canonical purine NTP pyrophosphatase [bacterium]|nr:non-canonical purine NTP pyrophosphatase [bacterium]